jgi:hypothetical protein
MSCSKNDLRGSKNAFLRELQNAGGAGPRSAAGVLGARVGWAWARGGAAIIRSLGLHAPLVEPDGAARPANASCPGGSGGARRCQQERGGFCAARAATPPEKVRAWGGGMQGSSTLRHALDDPHASG